MQRKLSFYIYKDSPIHKLNPLTKLVFAFTMVVIAFMSPFYWLPSILFLAVIIPLSFIGKIGFEFLKTGLRLLLPVFAFLFIMQSLFLPKGDDVILRIWVITATSESVQHAFLTASRILVMVSSFLIFLLSTSPSYLMTDLARRKFPTVLTYVITATLQILPQMQSKASTIVAAQRSRGLETEGNLMQRIKALLPLVSPLVFGSLVEVEERAIALEARAFNSNVTKTSLFDISDSTLDKNIRWFALLLIIVTLGSKIWLS